LRVAHKQLVDFADLERAHVTNQQLANVPVAVKNRKKDSEKQHIALFQRQNIV
jgi:hypothetical protein